MEHSTTASHHTQATATPRHGDQLVGTRAGEQGAEKMDGVRTGTQNQEIGEEASCCSSQSSRSGGNGAAGPGPGPGLLSTSPSTNRWARGSQEDSACVVGSEPGAHKGGVPESDGFRPKQKPGWAPTDNGWVGQSHRESSMPCRTSMEAAESSEGLRGKTGDSRSRDMTDDADGLPGRVMQAGAFGWSGGLREWGGESGSRDIAEDVGRAPGHRDSKGGGTGRGHGSGGKGASGRRGGGCVWM